MDTGATYTTLPRDVADALGCRPIGTRRVLLASGREEEGPVSVVSIVLQGQEGPTFCLIGPNGGPALLGAVTLEEFALGVDPVAKRLIPVRPYLTWAHVLEMATCGHSRYTPRNEAVTRVQILLTEEQDIKGPAGARVGRAGAAASRRRRR